MNFLYWHWVAAAASILLILSIFQLYQSNQQIEALSNQLIDNKQAVQKIQADLQVFMEAKEQEHQDKTLLTEPTELTKNYQKKRSPSSYKHQSKIIKETTVFNNVSNVDNSTYSKLATSSKSNLEEVLFEEPLISTTTQQLTEKIQNNNFNNAPLQKVTALVTLSSVKPLTKAINPLELTVAPINWGKTAITPILKKQPKYYIAADYAPVWNVAKNKGFQFGKDEFFPRRETQKTAYNVGLQFGIRWNKGWSLETGLRYNSVNRLIRLNKKIAYDLLRERLNRNGNYESEVNLEFGSSVGALETDVSLARASASMVEDHTDLNIEIASSSDVSHLDIPVIIKKEWTIGALALSINCLLYTSPSPRDRTRSRMPSSA